MKSIFQQVLLTTAAMFWVTIAYAQQPAEFGKISGEELSRKNSLIEKNAPAEVLSNTQEILMEFNLGHLEIIVKTHTRIKIYTEKGFEEADIKIPYFHRNNDEMIQRLEGQTFNLDAAGKVVVSKLEKKNMFDKRINNRLAHKILTFPEVKAGSVIEYKYLLRRKLLYFDTWYFQRNIPVVYSNVTIEYPAEFMFTPLPVVAGDMKVANKDGLLRTQSYTMTNIPSLPEEPFVSSREDYLQRIKFKLQGYFTHEVKLSLIKTWKDIIRELQADEDFGLQLKKNLSKPSDLQSLISKGSSYSKMVAIHDYVKKHMSWDGSHSIWALDGVRSAWEKRIGNSGEINLILVNLLRDAGLSAHPVMVSTHDNGRIITEDPGLNQFNTVMAYVKIDSCFYVLDGTDKYTHSTLIPPSVVYTEGLVINNNENSSDEKDWGWQMLWNKDKKFMRVVNIAANMDSKGSVSGNAFIMNMDYARTDILDHSHKDSTYLAGMYKSMHDNVALKSVNTKNHQADSLPLEQSLTFQLPAEENGAYYVMNMNIFSGLSKNPFLAQERSCDVFFGYNQVYMFRGSYTVPEGFSFEELPRNIRMVNQEKTVSFSRLMELKGNTVSYAINVEFRKPYFNVQEYPDFAEFYKQLFSLLNEPLVVKKTARP